MSKLFNLKKWLSIDEAAKHLSGVFSEPVNAGDVLRLGLDRHLTLSVNFVNHASAKFGRIVPIAEAKKIDGLLPTCKFGRHQFLGFMLNDDEVIEFDDTTVTIIGVFDLPLLGGDRLDVEQVYQMTTNGPHVTLQEPDGTFVLDSDGRYCQLQNYEFDFDSPVVYSPSPGKKLVKLIDEEPGEWSGQEKRGIWKTTVIAQSKTDYYCPAPSLPQDSVLVVRPDELMKFIQSVKSTPPTVEKLLATTERNQLLKMVVGMAIDSYGYDPMAKKNDATKQIVDDLAKLGIGIDADTVRKYLKEAANTVTYEIPKS